MNLPAEQPDFPTVADYLAAEADSAIRHEYLDGQVYAMTGASRAHGLIVNALAFCLTPAARSKGCQLFTSDMKVRLDIGEQVVFYYPDLLVTCATNDRETYFSRAPCLIVEVLSESTERIDRCEKMLAYRTLSSLMEYVLVAQDAPRVELYRRATDWHCESYQAGRPRLDCLEVELVVEDIYADLS